MSLIFKDEGHLYESIEDDGIKWISVTSIISQFKQPFDAVAQSHKSVKNRKSKWFGMDPDEVQQIWKSESSRATGLGTYYHNQREEDLTNCNTLTVDGVVLPIIPPIIKEDVKIAPIQRLKPGVYPEHFVYLKSAGICGQADYVDVVNDKVNIMDYKTNKEIKTRSYKHWDTGRQMMTGPLSHLEDCHLVHYQIQMSMYVYMMIKHNPKLNPGTLSINHITFEKEGEDKYGYPITKYDDNGDPIVKEIIIYTMEYLREEVINIINWLHDNRDQIKKK